jgi:hypothetical protein
MTIAATLRENDRTSSRTSGADQIITFHRVSWEDYERMLEIRGDKSAPRITYLEGELEIISPSKDHEQISRSSDISSRLGASIETSR